jgi:Flp pilus assembly protein TadB
MQTLIDVAIWLVIYILPLVLIVAIPAWLLIRFFRRRRADRRVETNEVPPENVAE